MTDLAGRSAKIDPCRTRISWARSGSDTMISGRDQIWILVRGPYVDERFLTLVWNSADLLVSQMRLPRRGKDNGPGGELRRRRRTAATARARKTVKSAIPHGKFSICPS